MLITPLLSMHYTSFNRMSISAILVSTLVLPSVAPNLQLILFYPVSLLTSLMQQLFVFAKMNERRRKTGRIIFSLPVVYGVIS